MDLKNYHITVGQILSDPHACTLALREIPQLRDPGIRLMAQNMTLGQVIGMARQWMPQCQIDELVRQLRAL